MICLLDLHGQEPVKVTILGVHHFSNPGADMFNINQDDVKAPKRQEEVLELVKRLVKFDPTKVIVESTYGNTRYPDRYAKYLTHMQDDSLSRNETEQLGFRIAASQGHSTIYPFDYRNDFDLSELENLMARDSSVQAAFQELLGEMGPFIEAENERLATSSLVDFLRHMNLDENIELNHSAYLRMLKMTGDDSYGASKGVSDWYSRNIHMFYNLNRIADFEADDERILVIVGQGHVKIIRDLIQDAEYYEYVDIMKFLE